MCGIIGFIRKSKYAPDLKKPFDEALYMHCLRGTDALGMLRVNQDAKALMWKEVGNPWTLIDEKSFTAMFHQQDELQFLVSHNRAATRGDRKNKYHAHPHVMQKKNKKGFISLMHNGTVSSITKGHEFDGDTDSQQLTHMLANDIPLDELDYRVFGSFALVWYDSEFKSLRFFRNRERPLGFVNSVHGVWFGSEPHMVAAALDRNTITFEPIIEVLPAFEFREWHLEAKDWTEKKPIIRKYGTPYSSASSTPIINQNMYDDDDRPTIITPEGEVLYPGDDDETALASIDLTGCESVSVHPFREPTPPEKPPKLQDVQVFGRTLTKFYESGKPTVTQYASYDIAKHVWSEMQKDLFAKGVGFIDKGPVEPQDSILLTKKVDVHKSADVLQLPAPSKTRPNSRRNSLKDKFAEVNEVLGYVPGNTVTFLLTNYKSTGQDDKYHVTGVCVAWDGVINRWVKSPNVIIEGNISAKKETLEAGSYLYNATITQLNKSVSAPYTFKFFVRNIVANMMVPNPFLKEAPTVEDVIESSTDEDTFSGPFEPSFVRSMSSSAAKCNDCRGWFIGSTLFNVTIIEGGKIHSMLICPSCKDAAKVDDSHLHNLFKALKEENTPKTIFKFNSPTTLQ